MLIDVDGDGNFSADTDMVIELMGATASDVTLTADGGSFGPIAVG